MKPYPKPHREVNTKLMDEIRAYGVCMLNGYSECYGGLDLHHIKSRGSGGGDVRGNLILLCRTHHQLAHAGKIKKQILYEYIERLAQD